MVHFESFMVHFLQFSEDLYKFVTESRGLQNGRSCDSLRRLWTSQHLAVAMSTVSVTDRHHKRGKMGKDGAAMQFAVKHVKNGRPHFECQLCQLQTCLTLFWYPVAIPEDFDRTPGVAWGPRRSTLLLCCSSNLPSDGSCRQGWFIVTTHGTEVQKCCAIRENQE